MAASIFAALLLARVNAAAVAQHDDVGILARAIEKQLGEKTNTGAPRIIQIRKHAKDGKDALRISLSANNSPTGTGIRNGVFTDMAKVFKILKSWGWPGRVESVVVDEYYCPARYGTAGSLAHLLFIGSIASEKIAETDWDSFDAGHIPELMDDVEMYEPIK